MERGLQSCNLIIKEYGKGITLKIYDKNNIS